MVDEHSNNEKSLRAMIAPSPSGDERSEGPGRAGNDVVRDYANGTMMLQS